MGVGIAGRHLHGASDRGVTPRDHGSVLRREPGEPHEPSAVGERVGLVRIRLEDLVVKLDRFGHLALTAEDRGPVESLLFLLRGRQGDRAGRRLAGKPDAGE